MICGGLGYDDVVWRGESPREMVACFVRPTLQGKWWDSFRIASIRHSAHPTGGRPTLRVVGLRYEWFRERELLGYWP